MTKQTDFKPGLYFVRATGGEIVLRELSKNPEVLGGGLSWTGLGGLAIGSIVDGEILSGPFSPAQLSAFPLLVEAGTNSADLLGDFAEALSGRGRLTAQSVHLRAKCRYGTLAKRFSERVRAALAAAK